MSDYTGWYFRIQVTLTRGVFPVARTTVVLAGAVLSALTAVVFVVLLL